MRRLVPDPVVSATSQPEDEWLRLYVYGVSVALCLIPLLNVQTKDHVVGFHSVFHTLLSTSLGSSLNFDNSSLQQCWSCHRHLMVE